MSTSSDIIEFSGAFHPLKTEIKHFEFPHGMTLKEMLDEAQPDLVLRKDAIVFIDDVEVHRKYWHLVRPKPGHKITARVFAVPRGGGGGGKNPLRILLQIAVVVATVAATIFGGPLAGAIVATLGNALIEALVPIKPPRAPDLSNAGRGSESPALFISGQRNQARAFEPVPVILGKYRFRPSLGAQNFTEVLGNKNILRQLFVVGVGPLDVSDILIGETPIEEFQNARSQIRGGVEGESDLTIYTNQVSQQNFSIRLRQSEGFTIRVSEDDADELSVDIAFPRGLTIFNGQGQRRRREVRVVIQWREVGTVNWNDIPNNSTTVTTFARSRIEGNRIRFTGKITTALRHGITWETGKRAQYEVRVRRQTGDTNDTDVLDETFWLALRTITDEDPIAAPVPLSRVATRFQATDQLNGVVDELSVFAQSITLDWDRDTQTWISRITNNPASLFRLALQGLHRVDPTPDEQINLATLQEWHEFCEDEGFTFNQVVDFSTNIQEILEDIAASGRAALTQEDGQYSVAIDRPTSIITTSITPRNSFNFTAEKVFVELPDAWRIRFNNEEEGYTPDERIVPRAGFTIETARRLVSLELPGVTNADQIFKLGTYRANLITQQQERWTVFQDYEALLAQRGHRVKLAHDTILAGVAWGRILGVSKDGSNAITAIELDEQLPYQPGESYALEIRRNISGSTVLTVPIQGRSTPSSIAIPITPIASSFLVEIDNLVTFGPVGLVSEDAQVIGNVPGNNETARVVMVPYREAIYDIAPVPTHVPVISRTSLLPPAEILEVITDESVLERGPGDTAQVRAEIRVDLIQFPGAFLEVQQRDTGDDSDVFFDSVYEQRALNAIRVADVQQGEQYDFRVRWNRSSGLPGPWTVTNGITILGRAGVPSGLEGLTISVFGGQAFLRWNEPAELDVRFGGTVRFRHSPSFDPGTTWAESTSIGDAARARALLAGLPLKAGTYFARVFDSDGNPSDIIASVTTKQASVLQYGPVSSLTESPTFPGVGVNVVATDNRLQLGGTDLFDDILDFDAVEDLDNLGGIALSGTYTFFSGFDFGTVQRVRLTTRLLAFSVNTLDTIDERLAEIDTWEDFDGTLAAQADMIIEVRTTDLDPSTATDDQFTAWERLDSAEFETRGCQFRAQLTTNDSAYNLFCTQLGVDAEEVV